MRSFTARCIIYKDMIDTILPFFIWQVSVYADSLVPTVRRALTDKLPEVREAAAETFDNLHSNIGQRALDEILPVLLKQLVGVL